MDCSEEKWSDMEVIPSEVESSGGKWSRVKVFKEGSEERFTGDDRINSNCTLLFTLSSNCTLLYTVLCNCTLLCTVLSNCTLYTCQCNCTLYVFSM